MTKLLILSSDTGEGHNSAASALELAASNAGLEVSIRKPLEESGAVNRSMGKLYNALLARRPQWMNRYFWLIDHCRPNERDIFYSKAVNISDSSSILKILMPCFRSIPC
jgi:hypothetical protein